VTPGAILVTHPLESYYNQFLDGLPTSELEELEIEFVAMCIGFPRSQNNFVNALLDLSTIEVYTIRTSVKEILRLDKLNKESIENRQVTKVEDITMNMNYIGDIKDELVTEVKKLARILKLPVLDNLYVSYDDVEGRIGANGLLEPLNRGSGFGSYLTGYTVR
uniref:Neck gp5 n=1 Tax=unclassified Caudoviricetes TaxID=2788787 RepID=UPI00311CE198